MPLVARSIIALGSIALSAITGCRDSMVEFGATAVTFVEVWAADTLHSIRDVFRTDEGVVLVLTGEVPFLHTVGRTKGAMRVWPIRSGRGPGDFVNPWAFVRGQAEIVPAVWDVGASRIASLDSIGGWARIRQFQAPGSGAIRSDILESVFGDPLLLGQLDGRLIFAVYPRGVNHQSDLEHGVLVTMDTLTASIDTLFKFTRSATVAGESPPSLALAPSPLWDICPGGPIVVFDANAERLIILHADGQVQAEIPWLAPRTSLTRPHQERYIRAMIAREIEGQTVMAHVIDESVSRMLGRAREIFSPSAPSIVRLRCGRDGGIWLQRFVSEVHPLGFGREWLIVDPAGNVAASVIFPPAFTPYDFSRDTVIGALIDTDDLQQIAVITVSDLTWVPVGVLNRLQ